MRIERFYSGDSKIEDTHFIFSYYCYNGDPQELIGIVKNEDKRIIRVEVSMCDYENNTGELINVTQFANKPVIPYTFKGPVRSGEYSDIAVNIVDENKNILLSDTFANPLLIQGCYPQPYEKISLTSIPLECYISNLSQNFLEVNGSVHTFGFPGRDAEVIDVYYQIDNNAQEKFEATESWSIKLSLDSIGINQYHMVSVWSDHNFDSTFDFIFKYISTPYFNYSLMKDSFSSSENFSIKYNLVGGYDDRSFNVSYKFGNEEKFIKIDEVLINEDPIFLSLNFPTYFTFGSQNITFQFRNDKTEEHNETTIFFKYLGSLSYPIHHDTHLSICFASISLPTLFDFSRIQSTQ